tara:strand:- start:107 stop:835 length:729 start_codon:yes stop_codon:yes gene_type:complete
MVINNASKLIAFLEGFNPSKKAHYDILDEILKNHPHFHLVQPYFLKAVEQLRPEKFDNILSHTAIATYDRQLLYDFLENQKNTITKTNLKEEQIVGKVKKRKKEKKKKEPKTKIVYDLEKKKNQQVFPKELPFSQWAYYLKHKNNPKKSNKILDKFELFDSFFEKKRILKATKEGSNKDDLSQKSLTPSDELMTETLAKVFVKQKKFENALQAYQILSLKYPEKNSFFADQIKEIKRLQQLK